MSSISTQPAAEVVDSFPALLYLLDMIGDLPADAPSLFIDLEGTKLGRHGTMSIISFYLTPANTAYLIDVYSLGEAAFTTTNSKTTSLTTILESSAIPKVIFDIRNDSDALFGLYGISVKGIKDLQLMELATRPGWTD